MEFSELVALLLTCAAVFNDVNARWVHLPTTIGLMVIAVVIFLGLWEIATGQYGFDHSQQAAVRFLRSLSVLSVLYVLSDPWHE